MNPLEPPKNTNQNDLKTTLSSLKTLIQQISQSTTLLSLPTTAISPQSHCPFSLASPSTFFYQNCPSVVSLPPPHDPLLFTLPHFLQKGLKGCCPTSHFRFLPSECMFVKSETDGWNDYPLHYSCIVRRLFMCLGRNEVIDGVSRWVLVNSPRYGLIIDVSVSDHVVLLLKLCLNVIVSEAVGLGNGDANEFYFKCPLMSQVLGWFGSQLGILFGEMNGKLFAIHLLRQLILNVANKFLMFSDERVEDKIDGFVSDWDISVSRVEDAVAALRERSLLEEKIKAVRYSRQLSCSQRVAEHDYISKRAEEERNKRPDFKPIIEHDLFSWQRGRNKDTSVTKSREELLAEERDYKRRRMSYRGKKIKRTTTQVMRDIIEEYTEEIKAAGGFGQLQHVAEESGEAASDSLPVCNTSADNVMEKGLTNLSDAPTCNRTESHSYKETRSAKLVDRYPKDLDQFKANQKADTNRYDRNYNARTPENLRNNGRTGIIEQNSVRGRREVTEVRRESSRRSPERNHRSSREHSRHGKEQYNGTEDISRCERSLGRSRRSVSVAHNKFNDRYDPSESYSTDEDDF